jgi:hypothetical protein
MNPTLEQLARYVVQELERGVPEITLYSALRESGWTQEWINSAFSTAKQRAVPAATNSLNMPAVHSTQTITQPIHHHSMRPAAPAPVELEPQAQPQVPFQPVQPQPERPLVRSVPRQSKTRSTAGTRKVLLIVIAILSVIVLGLGAYRTFAGIQHASQQRVVRDADRREDLSVLLSNLSDYFVTHSSYPTRTQMNTQSFLDTNGFSLDSITDPKWSPKDEACTKDGKPNLAGTTTPDCYVYEVSTSKNGVCNNGTTPCTKVKVSIWLEVDKKTYNVTFDKNTQVDN